MRHEQLRLKLKAFGGLDFSKAEFLSSSQFPEVLTASQQLENIEMKPLLAREVGAQVLWGG